MSVAQAADDLTDSDRAASRSRWPIILMWRLAMREMRSGLSGFGIFIACIALGVGVITGVGALTDGLLNGFAAQGRQLLGGDVTLRRIHQRASAAERAFLDKQGRTSELATMRSMARLVSGDDQALVEIKAVDAVYPMLGGLRLVGDKDVDAAIRKSEGAVVRKVCSIDWGLRLVMRSSLVAWPYRLPV